MHGLHAQMKSSPQPNALGTTDGAATTAETHGDEQDDQAIALDLFSSVFFWLLLWDSSACFLFVTALFGSIEGAGTGYGWRARQSS